MPSKDSINAVINSTKVMDREEDNEKICNSIALADAQVAHRHDFFRC